MRIATMILSFCVAQIAYSCVVMLPIFLTSSQLEFLNSTISHDLPSLIFGLFSVYLGWMHPQWLYSEAFVAYFEAAPDSPRGDTYWMMVAIWSLLSALVAYVSTIGLLFFKRWARWVYIVISLVGLISLGLFPLGDAQVSVVGEELISSIAGFFGTVVLVLLVTKPVSGYFSK